MGILAQLCIMTILCADVKKFYEIRGFIWSHAPASLISVNEKV
jgi:hypothetical protein